MRLPETLKSPEVTLVIGFVAGGVNVSFGIGVIKPAPRMGRVLV
jgi:hypothetical protein